MKIFHIASKVCIFDARETNKSKSPKLASNEILDNSPTLRLIKHPLNGDLKLVDMSGDSVKNHVKNIEEAILFCKQNHFHLLDETKTPPEPITQVAVKRYKKRPPSHVGKIEGAYNPKNWSGKLDTRLTPSHRYVLQSESPAVNKNDTSSNVDENTLTVGKIKSVNEAKRICIDKYGKIPWLGYEMLVDNGVVEITDAAGRESTNVWTGKRFYQYKTYLKNEAGVFSVRTWIDVNPGQITGNSSNP